MSRLTTAARRRPTAGRRGTILVVVLALLAIFAVIGIAFVFYSDGEALAARYHRESQTTNPAFRPPSACRDSDAENVLGQLLFGDYGNQLSGFRGHDLMATMYGGLNPTSSTTNTDPYTGQGIFHEKMNAPFDTIPSRGHVVNYNPIQAGVDSAKNPAYFCFDPEFTGPPRAPSTAGGSLPAPPTDQTTVPSTGAKYVSKAAPYTYPDLNNFYLASISPGTGETILPSFYRPWHFNSGNPNIARRLEAWNPNDPETRFNTDWVTAEGRARTLRPRPVDQFTSNELLSGIGMNRLPLTSELAPVALNLFNMIDSKIRSGEIINYPRPNQDGGTTGDEFNLIGGVGTERNDSILVDFGAAPFPWPPGSGNMVKPLAAVMITDLDGSLNLNAHGNTRNSGSHASLHGLGPWEVNVATAFGTNNAAEGDSVVGARYGSSGNPAARNGNNSLPYAPSAPRFGAYALVNWDGLGKAGPVGIPSFPTNPFNVTANYGGIGFYDDNTNKVKADNHPALYNPGDWGAFPDNVSLAPLPGSGSAYSIDDTRHLRQRYAGELDLYQRMTFFRLATPPTKGLIGDGATYAPGKASYKNDPAHSRRMLFTTLSADLDRPRMMGNPTGSISLGMSTYIHPSNAALANTLQPGTGSSVMPAFDLSRPLADYRDLNDSINTTTNPMTMKVTPNPQPINAGNLANADNAAADRQNMAREIFARLVLATGGKATVTTSSGDVTVDTAATTEEKNALRYLAQLAANIVDYIDADDVSTVFVWNPKDGNGLKFVDTSGAMNATDVRMVQSANMGSDADISSGVVFGVEMPRLVLNEVYSEITDDSGGKGKGMGSKMPTADGHVRFWAELLNPTTTPYATGTGPLNDGSVTFLDNSSGKNIKPYKLVIARAQPGGAGPNISDYVLTDPTNVTGGLGTNTADIDYDFSDAGAANTVVMPNKGQYYDPKTDPMGGPKKGFVIAGPTVVGATMGTEFDPPASGAMAAMPWDKMIQSPPVMSGATGTQKAMEYLIPMTKLSSADPSQPTSEYRRHVVLLRRLANPYLQPSATNPYITVDVMDYVAANDAVFTGSNNMMPGGVPMASRFSVGRVQPFAGQAKPDAAMAAGVPAYTFPNSFLLAQANSPGANEPKHSLGRHNGMSATAPTTDTVNPTPPVAFKTAGETLMAPFDWFIHLDRPLLSELELLHVQAVKPHQVTQYTFQPPKDPTKDAIRRSLGLAPWMGVESASGDPSYDVTTGYPAFGTAPNSTNNATGNGLYRAFELLRNKSRVNGTASGGRVQGKVNINTIQDARVLLALLDPQNGNAFSAGDVYNVNNPSDPATLWGRFIGSRTRGLSQRLLPDGTTKIDTTTPGKTYDDDPFDTNVDFTKSNTLLDRPFKSLGVAEAKMPANYGVSDGKTIVGGGNSVVKDGAMPTPMPAPFGPGLQDTILRVDATNKTTQRTPLAYTTGAAATHPYLQAEALRKLMNNTTTVSNVFAVHVTVVYHNVRMDTSTSPPSVVNENIPGGLTRALLGSEAYREVPGDMRQQYFAIVDRANAMVGSTSSTAPMTNLPFQAALASGFSLTTGMSSSTGTFTIANGVLDKTNSTVSVASDGQVFTLSASGTKGTIKTIFVGSGADRLSVDITSINTTTNPGQITVTDSSNTARTFPAGALVSNGIPGRPTNPGLAAFNPISAPTMFQYQYLVPYAARVR